MHTLIILSAAAAIAIPAAAQSQGAYGYGGGQNEGAVHACRQAVQQQAFDRFGGRSIEFRGTHVDSDAGAVVGNLEIPGANNNQDRFRFTCSMDFDNNQVQSVQIFPMNQGSDNGYRERSAEGIDQARENCRSAVAGRIEDQGFGRVRFDSMHADEGQGGRISGTARGMRGDRAESFDFTCSVERDGDLQSVHVTRR